MDTDKFISAIDIALVETDNIVERFEYYSSNTEPIKSVKEVLSLLKKEVQNHNENINKRVLRAMHDIGIASYREFSSTALEKALDNVIEVLYNDIPLYRQLPPLGMDFGKGDPV